MATSLPQGMRVTAPFCDDTLLHPPGGRSRPPLRVVGTLLDAGRSTGATAPGGHLLALAVSNGIAP